MLPTRKLAGTWLPIICQCGQHLAVFTSFSISMKGLHQTCVRIYIHRWVGTSSPSDTDSKRTPDIGHQYVLTEPSSYKVRSSTEYLFPNGSSDYTYVAKCDLMCTSVRWCCRAWQLRWTDTHTANWWEKAKLSIILTSGTFQRSLSTAYNAEHCDSCR